jgi:hypothetical protein
VFGCHPSIAPTPTCAIRLRSRRCSSVRSGIAASMKRDAAATSSVSTGRFARISASCMARITFLSYCRMRSSSWRPTATPPAVAGVKGSRPWALRACGGVRVWRKGGEVSLTRGAPRKGTSTTKVRLNHSGITMQSPIALSPLSHSARTLAPRGCNPYRKYT